MKSHTQIRYYRTQTDETSPPDSMKQPYQVKHKEAYLTQHNYFSNASNYNEQKIKIDRVSPKKLEKLENELHNIEKLKLKYETRKQVSAKPIQKQNLQKSRSLDKKHTLKPSQSPIATKNESKMTKSILKRKYKQDQTTLKMEIDERNKNIQIMKKQIQNLKLDLLQKDYMTTYLKQRIQQLERKLLEKDQTIAQLNKSKDQASKQLEKVEAQNEKIEKILKNVLYQRQKEKLNSFELSKTQNVMKSLKTLKNTNQNSTQPDSKTCIHNKSLQQFVICNQNSFQKIFISKNQVCQGKGQSNCTQNKNYQEQKKMRVQSILDKLKIKINRY